MTEERKAAIRSAITTLKAEGKKVTENAVLAELAAEGESSQERALPRPMVSASTPLAAAPPARDPDEFLCVVLRPFVALDRELHVGEVIDVGGFRQSNLSGLIAARYLRPYDPTLDAPLARPVVARANGGAAPHRARG